MRTIRLPRLPALLAALMVLSAAPLASRQKDLSDPDKKGSTVFPCRAGIST